MAEVASAAIDVEASSTADEGNLAAAGCIRGQSAGDIADDQWS